MQLEYKLEDIHLAATSVISNSAHKVLLFNGDMGAGKTTLIKEIARQLGVVGATSSPTFSLVNEYHISEKELLYHFDFYRLNSEIEALDFGIEDYLYSGHWCFIEWPEKIANQLPEQYTQVHLKIINDHTRLVETL